MEVQSPIPLQEEMDYANIIAEGGLCQHDHASSGEDYSIVDRDKGHTDESQPAIDTQTGWWSMHGV